MRLIINGVNDENLENIAKDCAKDTTEVWAAVAYATDASLSLLFDWCWKNDIPLKYYGRLDAGLAVNIKILQWFFDRKSPNCVCKLVQHHHAKVIWWRGAGLYIGSANLTDSAWNNNVEAGCFFEEDEIDYKMACDINDLFSALEQRSTPLINEVLIAMKEHEIILKNNTIDAKDFLKNPVFTTWSGFKKTPNKVTKGKRPDAFVEKWNTTQRHLQDIGDRLILPENRPSWVDAAATRGALVDQFLDRYYELLVKKNKSRKTSALNEEIKWWKNLDKDTEAEEMLNKTAPFLQSALSKESLDKMDEDGFRDICKRVHSIKDSARHAQNKKLNLPTDSKKSTTTEKINAFSKYIWDDKDSEGGRIKELLHYVLYGGTAKQLAERLREGENNPKWKVRGIGRSSLGEIVGWAMPEKFAPRNGRTLKALKALGYDVKTD